MSLITCKKFRGGGNSLELGVGRLFSFILSIVFVFVTSGAWAADWTDADGNTYTVLKSINGGGSGYINTEIIPKGSEKVRLKYKPVVTTDACIYCSRWNSNGNWINFFTGLIHGKKFRIDRNTTKVLCSTISADTEYSLLADYSLGTVAINGEKVSSSLGTKGYTLYHPLLLLGAYLGQGTADSPTIGSVNTQANGDLYYFQLWSSEGDLQHNFMPAVRDFNSVTGLYDTVTKMFYPATGGTLTGAAYDASERAGKKWTGAGGDNKMSTGANWEGGEAPKAGDDIDFTIAVPNAPIVADINASFNKIYLGAGDMPAFSGTLAATTINELERMTVYDKGNDEFTFVIPTTVENGTQFTAAGETLTGPIFFKSGSSLSVTALSADKAALAAPSISINGEMSISIPSQRFADGKYKILEMSNGQFGADVLNCLTLNGGEGDEPKKYALSVEGNTIYLEVTGGVESKWVGGVGDNRFSVASNWDNGKVPEEGSTLDFSGVASKTQINADVDIVYNTILIPVPSRNDFWDYYVQVSGTLHLNTITNATFLAVAQNGVLKVDGDVVLNTDAKKLGSNTKYSCYMFHSNKGRIEIGGNLVNEVTPINRVLMYISSSPGGVLKMGGAVNNSSDKAISLSGNHSTSIVCVIGENGLSGEKGFCQYDGSGAEITLKAGCDFNVGVYLYAYHPFKFDTSDETGTARKITLNAEIQNSGAVTIVGNGMVVANSSVKPGTSPVTVEGGATLAINPGKLITNGKMTVNSGATLSLPQSGEVTLGGDLTLADGAILAFNFTNRKVEPILALASEKSLSFDGEGEKNIAVKVSGDVWPLGGKHILTATGGFNAEGVTVSLITEGAPKWAKDVYVNEDGNIVLDVKPMGTKVIVR